MNVEIFKGNFTIADSAMKYIDVESISAGCALLSDACNALNNLSNKVISTRDYCTLENFSMNGVTVEDEIEFCGKSLKETSNSIQDMIEMLQRAMSNALDRKQTYLNEIAQEEEKQALMRNPGEGGYRL